MAEEDPLGFDGGASEAHPRLLRRAASDAEAETGIKSAVADSENQCDSNRYDLEAPALLLVIH